MSGYGRETSKTSVQRNSAIVVALVGLESVPEHGRRLAIQTLYNIPTLLYMLVVCKCTDVKHLWRYPAKPSAIASFAWHWSCLVNSWAEGPAQVLVIALFQSSG